MNLGLLFPLLVVAAVVAWWLRRRGAWPPASEAAAPLGFSVTFRDGEIVATRGVMPRAVHGAFADVASWHRLSGEVRLGDDGLEFSDDLDPGARQQLRNAFMLGRS